MNVLRILFGELGKGGLLGTLDLYYVQEALSFKEVHQ